MKKRHTSQNQVRRPAIFHERRQEGGGGSATLMREGQSLLTVNIRHRQSDTEEKRTLSGSFTATPSQICAEFNARSPSYAASGSPASHAAPGPLSHGGSHGPSSSSAPWMPSYGASGPRSHASFGSPSLPGSQHTPSGSTSHAGHSGQQTSHTALHSFTLAQWLRIGVFQTRTCVTVLVTRPPATRPD